ncbi:anthrone oxygenase family protein [Marinomonas sp. THO17]|uniref:anthrone oxygenase family protein n=1 Tax=Marinomonas sp. THO17 TaxID=3149048 RepID=UPI00336BE789
MTGVLIVLLGIMTGIYFAFSVFVMGALNRLMAKEAINVMNSINQLILRSGFMPVFFATSLCLFGAFIWHVFHWQSNVSWLWITSALIYLLGMFAITLFGNVPLNEWLKRTQEDADTSHNQARWREYSVKWTMLNHLRVLSSGVACYLLTWL